MPDRRRHRGPDPEDERLFGPTVVPTLRQATHDLCWLLNRGYAIPSARELVGNRYGLARRQRIAIGRCACTTRAAGRRRRHECDASQLAGEELWLDGFNVLTAVESALAGGFILRGRDRCLRDMAGVHARHHEVEETRAAIQHIGDVMAAHRVRCCTWWLDRPVANSGRLKRALLAVADEQNWNWHVELVYNPDKVLAESKCIIATSDSVILDQCRRWFNLADLVITTRLPHVKMVDLSAYSN